MLSDIPIVSFACLLLPFVFPPNAGDLRKIQMGGGLSSLPPGRQAGKPAPQITGPN